MASRSTVNSCILATVTLALSLNLFLRLDIEAVDVVAMGVVVVLKATHFFTFHYWDILGFLHYN